MNEIPEIQSLEPADFESAADLVAGLEFYRSYGYQADTIRELLQGAQKDPRSILLAAKHGQRVSGVAWLVSRAGFDRSAYLRMLAVSRSEQGQGLGRRLVEQLESRHLEPAGIFLMVTEDNRPARAFYEHLGYQHAGSVTGYVRKERVECIYFKPAVEVSSPHPY